MEKNKEINEKTETVTEEIKYVDGRVKENFNLNVRKRPNRLSEVVTVIDSNTKLKVSGSESTKDFYKVFLINRTGISGFCSKEFIEIEE